MVMGRYSLAVPTEVDRHGLLPPPGVTGCEPPVEVGPGVTPALLLLPPICFELLAELDGCVPSSVSAVTELGLMTIITGLPSEFFARTRKDEGMMVILVNPALSRSARSFWAMCMFAPFVAAGFALVSVSPFGLGSRDLPRPDLRSTRTGRVALGFQVYPRACCRAAAGVVCGPCACRRAAAGVALGRQGRGREAACQYERARISRILSERRTCKSQVCRQGRYGRACAGAAMLPASSGLAR